MGTKCTCLVNFLIDRPEKPMLSKADGVYPEDWP